MSLEPTPSILKPIFKRDAGIISGTEILLNYMAEFSGLPPEEARESVRYGFCIPIAYYWSRARPDLAPVFGKAWHGNEHGLSENHVWLECTQGEIIDPVGWQWHMPVAAYLPVRQADVVDMRKHIEKFYPGLPEILDRI